MSLQAKTILVVEDEIWLREALSELLKDRGAHVLEAQNGKDALEIIREHKVDILISDVRMPGGDGIKVISEMRNLLDSSAKILISTGYADIDPAGARAMGIHRIFFKPYPIEELISYLLEGDS